MPLIRSASKRAFVHNLKTELRAGRPKKQALAIAYSVQRQAEGDTGMATKKKRKRKSTTKRRKKRGAKKSTKRRTRKTGAKRTTKRRKRKGTRKRSVRKDRNTKQYKAYAKAKRALIKKYFPKK